MQTPGLGGCRMPCCVRASVPFFPRWGAWGCGWYQVSVQCRGGCPAAPPSAPWVLRAGRGPSLLMWSCSHGPWWSRPGAVQTCRGRLPALPCALGDLPPCSWVSFISATPLAGMKTDGAACGLHRRGDPFRLPFGLACHRSCRCSGLFAGMLGAFTMIIPRPSN